jgi:hypothetical protein
MASWIAEPSALVFGRLLPVPAVVLTEAATAASSTLVHSALLRRA